MQNCINTKCAFPNIHTTDLRKNPKQNLVPDGHLKLSLVLFTVLGEQQVSGAVPNISKLFSASVIG